MCLLLRNEGNELLDIRHVDVDLVREINARTYGWADRFIYGPTKGELQAIHTNANAVPANIPRPVAGYEVLLMPVDPDDPSFAQANHAAGRDPYIYGVGGDWSDYIVVDDGTDPVEAALLVSSTTEARLAKAIERDPTLAMHRGHGRFRTYVDAEGYVYWSWIAEADDPLP